MAVKISPKDITSAAQKLEELSKELPAAEQLAVRWLIERAKGAPANENVCDLKEAQAGTTPFSQAFNQALGLEPCFGRPGQERAVVIEIE